MTASQEGVFIIPGGNPEKMSYARINLAAGFLTVPT
jgi:hypothetical protein